ncbi:MAG: glycosyltransferase family 9 protein, partial [Calditrichaeota bacterium]
MSGEIKSILIVQTAFIGDVVLVEPLVARTKQVFPGAEVDVMVIPAAANLLETHPGIRRLLVYDKRGKDRGVAGFRRMLAQVKQARYDLALVPHRSLRSALMVYLAGIPRRIGFANSAGRWFFTQRLPYLQDHEVIRNLSLLTPFGAEPLYRKPEIYPTPAEAARIDRVFGMADGLDIALAPGSVWATKRWPETYFSRLAQMLAGMPGARIVLVGSKQDRAIADLIAGPLGKRCLNLAGQLNLRETVAALHRCRILISNDSAPTHLGVAAGCRVITLFGSTVPAFGFYPYGEQHRVVETHLALD